MAEPKYHPDPADPQGTTRGASGVRADLAALRRDDFDRNVWCVLGLPVDIADIDQAMGAIDGAVREKRQLSFVTPNVNWLVRALRDDETRHETINTDLSLVDGAPLVVMAKLLGVPVRSRVAGSDLFEALRRRPSFAGRPLKVFFFGGRDGAGDAAVEAVNNDLGGVEAVGALNPGHGDVESMSTDAVISEMNAAEPDFVLVALGAAKGQAWIERNRDRLTAPVTAHLGAVIDFAAGGVARAPGWMQRSGLEWAWRIKEEPSLWRRYFTDAVALVGIVLTRLMPQLVRHSTGAGTGIGTQAHAAIHHTGDETAITLSGNLTHGALRPVREAFRAASAAGRPTRLIFNKGAAFDRAFLGLVLMLEKHLTRHGAPIGAAGGITIEGLTDAQQRMLRANNMTYASGDATTDESAVGAAASKAAV